MRTTYQKILLKKLIILVFAGTLSGCSTVTGPKVTKEEIKEAQNVLEVKALEYRLKQVQMVNEIGYKLVWSIPKEDIKIKPRPFLGLFCVDRSEITNRYFNQKPEGGAYVAFVLENTPAAKAGIQKGDLVLAVDNNHIKNTVALHKRIDRIKYGKPVEVVVVRNNEQIKIPVEPQKLPLDVRFAVIDLQMVNAAAFKDQIVTTYGLLNFVKSQDEIAAVLGHELAHLSRGHIKRSQGGQALKFIMALSLGITAEVAAPGAGGAVMRGVGGVGDVFSAKFSRDLEREADYFGVKFMHAAGYNPQVALTFHERFAIEIPHSMVGDYLSSHPSSPERSVRIRKAIDELNQKNVALSESQQAPPAAGQPPAQPVSGEN